MKIQSTGLTRLLHNQHLTFHREFEALITEKNATTLDVATAFAAYQAAIEAEDAAMMKVVKSAITDEKEAADMKRDELLTGSFELIRVTTKHFDATKCAAAKRLAALLSTYQGSDKAEYNDETSRIRNYIQELRSEKYTADATAIGLILGYLAVSSNGIRYCVLVHVLINSYSTYLTLWSLFLENTGISLFTALFSFGVLAAVALFIAGAVWFFVSQGVFWWRELRARERTFGPGFRYAWKNPGFFLFAVISLLEMVSYFL